MEFHVGIGHDPYYDPGVVIVHDSGYGYGYGGYGHHEEEEVVTETVTETVTTNHH